MEVIGNALELRAFDRMDEDIRVIGYFKNEDSERECTRSYLYFLFVSGSSQCVSCVCMCVCV